jgi:hypothetical protein
MLIRAMGPTVESEERKHRVRRSLEASAGAARARWGWPVGLALGLLGVGAAAAAGGAAVSRLLSHDESAEAAATPPSSPRRAPISVPSAAPAPLPAEHETQAPESPTPAPPPSPANGPASRAALPRLSDVARVHEAAKALRHDGDAERALQLLEQGPPVSGPLAEEALALRIEASMARGNGRQAKLATAYLVKYPRGRYRGLANKALMERKP